MKSSPSSSECEEAPQSSATALIIQELSQLDAKAEALGAIDIRKSIANAIEDITEPAGKESARMAIGQIRKRLSELRSGRSRSSLPPALHLDEATA